MTLIAKIAKFNMHNH